MDGDDLYDKLLRSEDHYTLPVVALIDTLVADEVKIVNRLLVKETVTLLSKTLKPERLKDLLALRS